MEEIIMQYNGNTTIDMEGLMGDIKESGKEIKTVADVEEAISRIAGAVSAVDGMPPYVLTPSIYTNEATGEYDSIKLTIRPSAKARIQNKLLHRSTVIYGTSTLESAVIKFFYNWVYDYFYIMALETNLNEFNAVVDSIAKEKEVPFTLKFGYGDGVLSLTDDEIVIGLDAQTILNFGTLMMFSDVEEFAAKGRESFANIFNGCVTASDILVNKSKIAKSFGVNTRLSLKSAIKKRYNRQAVNMRSGAGMYNDKDVIAIIRKVITTEDGVDDVIATFNGRETIVVDNKMNKSEAAKGENKVVIGFDLSPLTETKEDGVTVVSKVTKGTKAILESVK